MSDLKHGIESFDSIKWGNFLIGLGTELIKEVPSQCS